MKSFFKFIFVLLLVGAVAAIVASIVSKKKLESMSDDEIREFLGLKLAGKVGDDQLATIQDAVISGVRGKQKTADHYIEESDDAEQTAAKNGEVAADVIEELVEDSAE